MTEVKNTKVTANVTSSSDSEQVEYVTFWGQLKGDLEKQTDLSKVLGAIKRSVSDLSTKYLRKQDKLTPGNNITIEKDSEDDLVINGPTHTSQLVNDGEGAQDSEGSPDKFTLRSEVSNIADILNAKVEDVEFELNNKIYDLDSEVNTKQDKLAAGDGILLEDNVISVSSSTIPGNGKLTINLNGSKLADFFANQNEDTIADINIQTVPDADPELAGKLLGLNEEGTAYKFYSMPQELPEISDSSYDGKVLTVNESLEPEWKDPQVPTVNSNIFYVDVAPQWGPTTTYTKNKTAREIYDAYKDGLQVIVRYHPDGNILGSTIYMSYMTLCTFYEEDGELASQSLVNFDYRSSSGGRYNINISIHADDSILVSTY